ncbi:OmpL47-type beta-barrel domain-containing protein [Cohnella sp.]|uniref:rhamnogalacturonan lyase family protein n=1 Tax=Cohnella sp. TaxID=1883426 RepID=UPI003567A002
MKKLTQRGQRGIAALLSVLMLFYAVVTGVTMGALPVQAQGQTLKFDFGTETSPVMEGFQQVHNNLLYTPERGYGLTSPTNARDRSGGDALTNDFIIPAATNPYTFLANVPNGNYDVTVYSGDLLVGTSTTKTSVTIEGELKGTIQTRQAVTSAQYRATVADGQMTIDLGTNGYLNGVIIEPVIDAPPAVPEGLEVTGVNASENTPSVSLKWNSVTDAVAYDLYRNTVSESTYGVIARLPGTDYTDTGVLLGSSYEYRVASVSASGLSSELSAPVIAQVKLPDAPPAAPTNLTVSSVGAQSVTLQWTATEGADGYTLLRSASEDGAYSVIDTVISGSTTSYTDTTADTSALQYYRVQAFNAFGVSAMSTTSASPVYTPPQPLPDGDTYRFDFGSGALADGYIRVGASSPYSSELKYGFADISKVVAIDRGTADPLKSDFVSPVGTSFAIDLPNGDYAISLISGDEAEAAQTAVKVESIPKVLLTDKPAGQYLEINFEIALVDGQLNFDFSGDAPKINALVIIRKPDKTPGELPTVYLAGDSTVQTYDEYWKPEAGWGQMIPRFFTDQVIFKNHAIGGRSSKTFITEGRLDEVLRAIMPGDYFMVQFGHNDATISVPERYASVPDYKNYLKTYVNGVRQRGATPILVTPMGRRSFDAATGKFNVSFAEYVQGMKEVAQELNVSLVDLSTLSIAYYDSIGPEAAKSVFLHVEPGIYNAWPNGVADDTHFQEYGAIQLARMLSGAIEELNLPISAYVKDAELPPSVPAKPTGLTAGSVSNAGAVLSWDAVETAEIYKIYRKLSTDTDYAMAGTARVPTFSAGGMQEGQSYDLYVTAVNGRGESEPSDSVTITTKAAQYRYDFGPVGSPVEEGYTGVYLTSLYTPEQGYGIKSNANMITRDRGSAGTDLTRDWLGYFNAGWEFMIDLPNGAYAVKLYVGDLLGTARTDVTIEGTGYGTVNAGRNAVAEKSINQIQVKDGQMNLFFGGSTGIVNGLEITPILQAPLHLKVDDMNLELDQPYVKLSWSPADNAVHYRVYRRAAEASKAELMGTAASTEFTDSTVDVGIDYEYSVSSLDSSGFETVPSIPLNVSMIDPTVPVTAAPGNLTLGAVNKHDISFSWDTVAEARKYNVYRAEDAAGPYELIGKSSAASYTDAAVLTTIPYYYKVAAINAGGISQKSETLATPAVTKLVRQMEYIDRAPVAIETDAGIYIGWRLLGLDQENITFNLYRDGVKLNASPIRDSTNFTDAEGTPQSTYKVFAVLDGVEKAASSEFGVWQQNHLSVPLRKPADDVTKDGQPYTYSAGDASVADLDGDGKYEIVMLWNPSNAKDNSQGGYTGIVYMDAYKLDGTRLWRINMGPNIRAGAHYTQFMAYDLDGDGKAEIAFKTADGTVDGQGNVIGKADVDYRNSGGYVLLGNEYLTVFDGMTGKALATTDYDPPRGDVGAWGDAYGNRVDRFLATVAYLDGERPSLVMSRGYYTRTVLAAYNYRDGQLTKVWRFDTNDEGNASYAGQGNHNLSVGDVDGDGKDEINFGAMALDDDGTILYNTGLGHGDALHFGDLDPARPGLELFDVHEHTDSPYGYEMRDAKTGQILWGVHTGLDTGRGMSADIDPNHLGEEVWSANITDAQHIPVSALHNAQGEVISSKIPTSTNFGVWWDGDLLRELQDYNRIDKWDYVNETTMNLFTAEGSSSNNSTKANSMLQADLFGDWREEVMWRADDSSELRIYSTTIPTEYRIRTLMHDPNYRLAVAWQNVSYNQPPHPGFYLGEGMVTPPKPSIYLTTQPDENAPTTTHTVVGEEQNGWYKAPVMVSFTAVDDVSGVASTYYRVSDSAVQSGMSVELQDEGRHTIGYWSVDQAGNTENERTVAINLDLTAPVISFSVADGAQIVVDQLLEISCEASDALSGIETSTCENIAKPAYELGLGAHVFSAEAADQAGHITNVSVTIQVGVDYESLSRLTSQFIDSNKGDSGIAQSLINKLNAAHASEKKGDEKAKNGQLGAYINQVQAQSGKALTVLQAEILIGLAQALKGE